MFMCHTQNQAIYSCLAFHHLVANAWNWKAFEKPYKKIPNMNIKHEKINKMHDMIKH